MGNNYKQTVSGTIGAGMKSVFGGQGRKYYILEHKVSSQYHRAGESQEIIVDQIEIGRDARCQVRFDESFSTVSRRHAAIVRSGDGWKLVQLSTVNKTLLNGVPVEKEWYLQNGDEIQLSVNGPKLGFIVPQGNKSTINTIGLSRRLSLFRQQALRPYKTAMTILSILLVLAIAAGIFFIIRGNNEIEKAHKERIADSIEQAQRLDSMAGEFVKLQADLKSLKRSRSGKKSDPVAPKVDPSSEYTSSVFYIQTVGYTVELNDETAYFELGDKLEDGEGNKYEVDGWIGTAFLLNNGKLVTARHCVEGWLYYSTFVNSAWQLQLNSWATSGAKVNAVFVAVSPSGEKLNFTSHEVMCNRGNDKHYVYGDFALTIAGNEQFDPRDFAWFSTNLSGGLAFDAELSDNLKVDTKLEVYGFPHGWGVKSFSQVSAIKGSGVVARDGLEQGCILVGEANFESGHSGAPALYKTEDGKYVVVGIVSAKSQSYGYFVPISRVK